MMADPKDETKTDDQTPTPDAAPVSAPPETGAVKVLTEPVPAELEAVDEEGPGPGAYGVDPSVAGEQADATDDPGIHIPAESGADAVHLHMGEGVLRSEGTSEAEGQIIDLLAKILDVLTPEPEASPAIITDPAATA